jgi:glycosyltransferase involved in cell wall biosynthesis
MREINMDLYKKYCNLYSKKRYYMMKIAIDCRMLGTGGIGTYIAELIPYFLEKYTCLLIGEPEKIEAYRNYPNAELCPCTIPVFSLRELAAFPKSITNRINMYTIYYTPYCNIPSGIHIPVFSTIHDVVFLDVPGLASKTGTLVRKWFYTHAVKKSHVIFTVSQFSSERIRKTLRCRKPVVVTYSAVPSWLKDEEHLPAEKTKSVLFVGNIKKHKGLHILLAAFRQALSEGLAAQLIIVGNADNFRTGDNAILREIQEMPAESVQFTGKISDRQLKTLYKNAALLVQPSLYEGFGLPPLEALSLGTNALISDIPVFREIYAEYPVHFFKQNDSGDLAEKLKQCTVLPPPEKVPELYSFSRTFSLIAAAVSFYKT